MIKKSENSNGASKIIQTYAEDMAKIIENDTEGLVKKIIHGEAEHEKEKRNLSPESRKNKFFMLVSVLLLITACIILLFSLFQKEIYTVNVEKQFTPIIFNDKSDFIEVADLNKDKIAQAVYHEANSAAIKGVEGIYLTSDKKIVGLRKFITLIKSSFVPDTNNFVNDNFLLGTVSNPARPAGGDFFVLLKVRTLSDVFDQFRAWENKMFYDLHGFFGVNLSPETNYLFTKNFEDGIVENKNARVLYDQDNRIVMMYIFADETSVIITNSQNAAREIMLRLASSQIKK